MKRIMLLIVAAGLMFACGEEKKEEAKEPPKVSLIGHFEAKKSVEVKFDVEHLGNAKVRRVAGRGIMVEQGDFLISFERDAYNDQLKAANRKMATTELTRKEAEFEHEQFVETQKLSKQAAEREWAAAQDAYQGYREFDRQYAIDSAKFSLKQSRNSLEYLEEDLRQLERMYLEDELTEDATPAAGTSATPAEAGQSAIPAGATQ